MSPGRILVVDDDAGHVRSLSQVLTAAGHEVISSTDGATGLDLLRNHPAPDVVLLDLNMPGVDGFKVLAASRHLETPPHVIVVSGDGSEDAMRRLLRLGAFDYLRKPYLLDELLQSVSNAVAHQRSEADATEVLARVRESDQLHRFLVDQSPDVIYTLDAKGCFTFLSASATAVFGRPQERLRGAHWTELFDPDEVRRAKFRFDERRTAHRSTTNLELKLAPTDDALQRWIEVSATGLYSAADAGTPIRFEGTYGVARDVSERRRIASALARSERKFATLFQSSPDALFISSANDGAILERNEPYDELMRGFDNVETDLWLFEGAGDRRNFIRSLQERGGVQRRELLRRDHATKERALELSVRLLVSEERLSLVSILRDVTAERHQERERLRLEGQLQQARRLEAIGQLSGGIAHDFNNILASMIGYAELAQLTVEASDADERCGEYLSEVISAGQRARDLIAQLLNFSRTEPGNLHPVNLGDEVDGILRMLRAVMPTSIEIRRPPTPELPTVTVDPVQLQQVVINLFINAREAIAGEGVIDIGMEPVDLHEPLECSSCRAAFDGPWLRLTVSDDGCGIPEEIRDQLFGRLVTTRAAGRGTGFGLSLIHGIMHQYQGHVQVESTVGEGTTFRLYFPLGAPGDRVDARPIEPPAVKIDLAGANVARRGGHVVVVDDEVSVANFLSELLEHAGYRTTVFNDPGTALEYLRGEPQVNLIITDQTMPHLTGVELATAVALLRNPPPVILCTGYGNTVAEDVSRQRIKARLAKPFRLQELLDAVETVLAAADTAPRN